MYHHDHVYENENENVVGERDLDENRATGRAGERVAALRCSAEIDSAVESGNASEAHHG